MPILCILQKAFALQYIYLLLYSTNREIRLSLPSVLCKLLTPVYINKPILYGSDTRNLTHHSAKFLFSKKANSFNSVLGSVHTTHVIHLFPSFTTNGVIGVPRFDMISTHILTWIIHLQGASIAPATGVLSLRPIYPAHPVPLGTLVPSEVTSQLLQSLHQRYPYGFDLSLSRTLSTLVRCSSLRLCNTQSIGINYLIVVKKRAVCVGSLSLHLYYTIILLFCQQ